jgi:hypothetical protein
MSMGENGNMLLYEIMKSLARAERREIKICAKKQKQKIIAPNAVSPNCHKTPSAVAIDLSARHEQSRLAGQMQETTENHKKSSRYIHVASTKIVPTSDAAMLPF